MEAEYWRECWEQDQIAFNQAAPNPLLVELWPELGLPAGSEVFVPLCGKSVDMAWLADRGHRVVGCELSRRAVDDFFAERDQPGEVAVEGGFTVGRGGPYELWCGDLLQLAPGPLAGVTAAYDRAGLVALPPEMRERYARHLTTILPAGARMLVVAFEYEQALMEGPPFSVTGEEIERLYGHRFRLEPLAKRELAGGIPQLRERGVTRLEETAVLLTPAPPGTRPR